MTGGSRIPHLLRWVNSSIPLLPRHSPQPSNRKQHEIKSHPRFNPLNLRDAGLIFPHQPCRQPKPSMKRVNHLHRSNPPFWYSCCRQTIPSQPRSATSLQIMTILPWRKEKLASVNYLIIDLPAPANLTRFWNLGSILGILIGIQIVTGFLLATRYIPDIRVAFDSVIRITRNVPGGWILRNLHANGATLLFGCLYLHIGRGLYFNSYNKVGTWLIGSRVLVLIIATAFMGYLLPWGQIRFWGATVITNLFSAIPYVGTSLVEWMWGGYRVGAATLTRFYAGHFLLPFIVSALALGHLLLLHNQGSSNPLGITSHLLKVPFHPHYRVKDSVGFMVAGLALGTMTFYAPNLLTDPENFIPANPLVTPTHIKPEIYFLWAYAILRSIPNKLAGVILMFTAIGIIASAPLWNWSRSACVYSTPRQVLFWIFCRVFMGLTWVGGCPVETPYIELGQLLTVSYFLSLILFYLS